MILISIFFSLNTQKEPRLEIKETEWTESNKMYTRTKDKDNPIKRLRVRKDELKTNISIGGFSCPDYITYATFCLPEDKEEVVKDILEKVTKDLKYRLETSLKLTENFKNLKPC